jgi:ribosome recycling factor
MIKDFEEKMRHTLEGLDQSMSKIRTGRAHAPFLEGIVVMAYGQKSTIKQIAAINVQDARTLVVVPWDKGLVSAVNKGIQESDLGLNPVDMGDKIIVPMPILTEERRKDLIKLVKTEGERCRVALRHHRRDILTESKNSLKQKEITEDEDKRLETEVDKIIDRYNKQVDEKMQSKEKELMAV